jgi:two-component system, sensor histidine kinase and response regulator
MDCHMPVMDGYTATRELRLMETRKGLPHQPVIAQTANALEGEREKCSTAGMNDYLTKPIVTEKLIEVLASWLGPPVPALDHAEDSSTVRYPVARNPTAALEYLEGDREFLYELIALFLTEAPKQLLELSRSQKEGNQPELANTAHAIKDTVAHFYADKATECARLLQHAARSGQPADYRRLTEDLVKVVTDLINNLLQQKESKLPWNYLKVRQADFNPFFFESMA